jgi:hypothetical protein
MIATSTRNTVHLRDLAGKLLNTIEMDQYVWAVAFDPSGGVLATGYSHGPICLTAVDTRERIATLNVRYGVQHLAFAPDGTLAAEQSGDVYLWSTRVIGKDLPPKAAARTDDGDLDARLRRIREKIAKRQLSMNEPATLEQVEAFERRYRVTLPLAYRRFILEVANGGSGPGGALLPLGGVPDGVYPSADEALCNLSMPFPLTKGWCWEDDEPPCGASMAATRHGHLYLVNQGCGMFWILIVNGPSRNEVWQSVDVGIIPCEPRRDFLSWFEYWLDGGHDWWEDTSATQQVG